MAPGFTPMARTLRVKPGSHALSCVSAGKWRKSRLVFYHRVFLFIVAPVAQGAVM